MDSTNLEARRRLDDGPGGVWVLGGMQTQGRGRRARAWVSEPGNLYASVAFTPNVGLAGIGAFAFASALALHDAVLAVAPDAARDIYLKWPNDLMSPRGKLSGILLECESGAGTPLLTIGWGVNCTHHPENSETTATDFAALGHDVRVDALFDALVDAFTRRAAQLEHGGMAALRGPWLERARGVGQAIRVRLDQETLDGEFRDLDSDGRLVLALPNGETRAIAAGDVFFANMEHATAHE
ncbi:biotin--[acetyl-CoA-carboxylase] ligase [Tepidamorphus sp. 3E244]|uniref:biotin--[acetyl-CoA-carboxylase] ligase n=1 Tax=Tepidamorphus sp. 3E244 TaxID=3385498 RepID=UPI0038FBE84D